MPMLAFDRQEDHPYGEVKRDGLVDKLVVRADGTGQVGHAGSALLDWCR